MKEEILNVLKKLGFQLREFRNDTYGFQYEDINFLFLYDEDDNNFLNIAVPAVAKVCDDNVNDILLMSDRFNYSLKYVKAHCIGETLWLSYERELLGGEDFQEIIPKMIINLEKSLYHFRQMMNGTGDGSRDDSSFDGDDIEDASEDVT